MKFIDYIKDKIATICLFLGAILIVVLMLLAFHSSNDLIIAIIVTLTSFFLAAISLDYYSRKRFYNTFTSNLEGLDQKYLIIETVKKPDFFEGKILFDSLYDIDKSMIEKINSIQANMLDFKEYIELWIHEVKVPLSSLLLMAHNHQDQLDKKAVDQLKKIENYVEQVLYYVRSENAEKDYLITKNNLSKIVMNVALKNKNDLLEKKIDLIVSDIDQEVLTDSKWLEFMLNQIMNNSIKYSKNNENSYIKITSYKENNHVILEIEDNGIGIPTSDLNRVFEKSFTGINGRAQSKSTGMGLYLVSKLCARLNHRIEIDSKQGEWTKIRITFNHNAHYDVLS